MSKTTPATLLLTEAGVPFTLVTYNHDPSAASIGPEAAEVMGAEARRVLKTLMAESTGRRSA